MAVDEKHVPDPELVTGVKVEHNEKRLDSNRAAGVENGQQIQWTFMRVVAVISLCLVYVGKYARSVSALGIQYSTQTQSYFLNRSVMPYVIYIQKLQEVSSWRWVFCIAGICNFIGLLGIVLYYHPPPRHHVESMTKIQILKQIDYFGAFLSIVGVTLFLVGLQVGGYQFPWTGGRVLGPLIAGILLILGFIGWELWGTSIPMAPAEIFKGQRVVTLAPVIVFVAGMDFYSILGFSPVMLKIVYPAAPITIGVRALGYPIAILRGACIVSTLMSYTRSHVREMFLVASLIMTAFGGALAATNPSNPGYAIAMAILDLFGIGAIVVPALTLSLYACPDRYIGTTTALSLCTRFLDGSVGTAIYFNIFNTKAKEKLPQYIGSAAVRTGLLESSVLTFVTALVAPGGDGAPAAFAVPGVNQQILEAGGVALRWAYNDSLKYVWIATIPFGVVCVLCCLALPNIRAIHDQPCCCRYPLAGSRAILSCLRLAKLTASARVM